tara:strand:- start:10551 stop:12599 length:2049 start_codon:yes stop_codon:yes gene_type:complete
MNRKEFTNLLLEWRNSLLLEVKAKDFKRDLVPDIVSEDDYFNFIFNDKKGKFKKPFTDNLYLQIVYNSYMAGQNHSIQDFIELYDIAKQQIIDPFLMQGSLEIRVPGEDDVLIKTLEDKTYNDIESYIRLKSSSSGKSSSYKKCLEERSNNHHFEIIFSNEDWVVTYPKTQIGSISLARSYWDGSKLAYDETFDPSIPRGEKTGVMNWCTSVSGTTNMFINYHIKMNLHMYYIIKKNTSPDDQYRKLCLSFLKKSNRVQYYTGHASVDGNNDPVKEEIAFSILGEEFKKVIYSDASSDVRIEIDPIAYYKSISFEQYLILRRANEENIDDFITEAAHISRYSKDKEKIIENMSKEKNYKFLKEIIFNRHFYLDMDSSIRALESLVEAGTEQEILSLFFRIKNLPFINAGILKKSFMKIYKIINARKLNLQFTFDYFEDDKFTSVFKENEIREIVNFYFGKPDYTDAVYKILLWKNVSDDVIKRVILERFYKNKLTIATLYDMSKKSSSTFLLNYIMENDLSYAPRIEDTHIKQIKTLAALNKKCSKQYFDNLIKTLNFTDLELKTNNSKYVKEDSNTDEISVDLYPGFHNEIFVNLNKTYHIYDTHDLVKFILRNRNCTLDTISHWEAKLSSVYKVVINEDISYGLYDNEDEIYEKYPHLKEIFKSLINDSVLRQYINLLVN